MLKFILNRWSARLNRLGLIANLTAENLALRQQLFVMKRAHKRIRFGLHDRLFWILLPRLWPGWRGSLIIAHPDTVVRWHKEGFKFYWRWKSRRRKNGRPRTSRETRELVSRMATENPLWGAPRIHGELLKLGIEISEQTVSNLMPKRRRDGSSQSWRTFLRHQAEGIVAIDFFVVPTITYRLLYVFILLKHHRRQVLQFGVTQHPTAQWTAQQTVNAFDWKDAQRYLLRDRDRIYGNAFRSRIKALGVQEIITAYRSPWQSGYVERLNGSIRRECLDHIIIWNERHLRRALSAYLDYYHQDRTHLDLGKDPPIERPLSDRKGATHRIVAVPRLGGLHHRYEWAEAA